MKIAVSSYSYNQRIAKGEMTQLDALKMAAEQGFEGIEFTDLRPENKKSPLLAEQIEYAKVLRAEAERLERHTLSVHPYTPETPRATELRLSASAVR